MSTQDQNQNKSSNAVWQFAKPFIFGCFSGVSATCVIQPIDTIKVRIQIANEQKGMGQSTNTGLSSIFKVILKEDGFSGFYKGLGSALLRQVLYASTRLGLYNSLSNNKQAKEKRLLKISEKIAYSLIAGFVGSLVGNPADLTLVRFQADSMLPLNERRNYKNVFDALARIVKEEGFISLWRGSGPTVLRAIAMNVGQLTSFDELKERIAKYQGVKENTQIRLAASAGAGFVCAFMSLPFDNLKTKLQKMKAGPDGKMPYTGFVDCALKSIAREGITGLWVGYGIFCVRVCPHAMITLMINEELNVISKRWEAKH